MGNKTKSIANTYSGHFFGTINIPKWGVLNFKQFYVMSYCKNWGLEQGEG